MVKEPKEDNEEQEQKQELPPPTYEQLVTEEPEREVELEEYDTPKTVSDAMAESGNQSDLKAVLQSLTPTSKNERLNEFGKSAMVTRTYPDNVIDKQKCIVLDIIESAEEDDADVDIMGAIMYAQDVCLIGLQGKGIADRIEIAGAAHEQDMEKLSKDLGI